MQMKDSGQGGVKLNDSSFYREDELKELGLRSCGENVLISRKCSIYGAENIELGDNVRIDDFCILSGKIVLGRFIHIAAYSALFGGSKGIYMDNFANISSRVSIYGVTDDYSGVSMTNPMVPEQYKKVYFAPVHIRKHVIIGATSVVMPGVCLEEGSAFGAFSFIDHDSESWSVNVGIPFRKIKNRSRKALDLEQRLLDDMGGMRC